MTFVQRQPSTGLRSIFGPRMGSHARAVTDTAEIGVWESAARGNALRTSTPRPAAA
jgi:hypothetical protein